MDHSGIYPDFLNYKIVITFFKISLYVTVPQTDEQPVAINRVTIESFPYPYNT